MPNNVRDKRRKAKKSRKSPDEDDVDFDDALGLSSGIISLVRKVFIIVIAAVFAAACVVFILPVFAVSFAAGVVASLLFIVFAFNPTMLSYYDFVVILELLLFLQFVFLFALFFACFF